MRTIILLFIIILVAGSCWLLFDRYQIEGLDRVRLVPRTDSGERATTLSPLPAARAGETIRIASFNVQVFGTTKLNKPHVMEYLANIARRFDMIAIQEVRSRSQDVVPRYVELINSTGRHYDYVIGPRLGRTHSKEQYAFIFDRASIEVDRTQLYTVDDPDDLLHHEPFVGWFRARGPERDQAFTFTLVNVHIDPDEIRQEMNVMDDVYAAVRDDGRGEDDVIVLGDFSSDDVHLGPLGRVPDIIRAISGVPTNTSGNRLYDNILFHCRATTEFNGRAGVLDIIREFNLTVDQAREISDHFPVWAEFSIYEGGQPGRVAVRRGSPKGS